MNNYFKEIILKATRASDLFELNKIQDLWSGYGRIARYGLKGGTAESVVVKHVHLPKGDHHPRGWNTDLSHNRKLKSYAVETVWYHAWSHYCEQACYVPQCLALEVQGDEVLMVLEDLDQAGYQERKTTVSLDDMKVCLKWLAHFHATFMGKEPEGLWPVGTYWHLDTRPDEWGALDDEALKQAAQAIDQKLQTSAFQTFVHGDAKLSNFCFSSCGRRVAAVDFQYVGGGCGMKDVAYFIGSCLQEEECAKLESILLDVYFQDLLDALVIKKKDIDGTALVKDWRLLFPVAWTDFHRFIKGWSPGHWKINSYSEKLARETLEMLCC